LIAENPDFSAYLSNFLNWLKLGIMKHQPLKRATEIAKDGCKSSAVEFTTACMR
jgi:hypothetical protein